MKLEVLRKLYNAVLVQALKCEMLSIGLSVVDDIYKQIVSCAIMVLDDDLSLSHSTNTFGKGINQTILLPVIG